MSDPESNSKKQRVQIVARAPGITHLKIHLRAGVCREPCRKTIIVRQIRTAENFSVGVKDAPFARSQSVRRCGGAFEHLADDSLIAGSSYRIRRSTEIHDRR